MSPFSGSISAEGSSDLRVDDQRDRELMARIRGGDMEAFERLYRVFYHRLFRFIFRTTQRLELVEDVLNETMLVVLEKPERFDQTSAVSTWIFGIAYRKALKATARQTRWANQLPLSEIEDRLVDGRAGPARRAEAEDLLAVALRSLSPEQRAVVELTYGHGLHYRSIAEILGCPENTVKTRMFQARRRLQALFGEWSPAAVDEDRS